jgi:hypothetical protein
VTKTCINTALSRHTFEHAHCPTDGTGRRQSGLLPSQAQMPGDRKRGSVDRFAGASRPISPYHIDQPCGQSVPSGKLHSAGTRMDDHCPISNSARQNIRHTSDMKQCRVRPVPVLAPRGRVGFCVSRNGRLCIVKATFLIFSAFSMLRLRPKTWNGA